MKIILLLTGCVVPNSNDILVIKDVATRKKQYIDALEWYLKNTDYHIVFGENSGTDLSSYFDEKDRGRIEFLTYLSAPTIPDRSKGYKEMEIIEYCLSKSEMLKEADVIMKGTGRLILKNVKRVIKSIHTDRPFVASWMWPTVNASDSRFFFCSYSFLKYFVSNYKEKIGVDKTLFEMTLAMCIKEKKSSYRYEYPIVAANVHGIGGGGRASCTTPHASHIALNRQRD